MQSHIVGVGTEIVELNFAAHNYYSASNPGIYGQISCENGNGSYSDRGQLVLSTGYGGNQITERLVLTSDGRGLSQFTAKAWANWNGTGTLAIRDSHNVSSVSDYGTGWYAPTYANSMANTNYGVYACGSFNNSNRDRSVSGRVQNAGSAEVFSQADNTATDNADCYVLIFGD